MFRLSKYLLLIVIALLCVSCGGKQQLADVDEGETRVSLLSPSANDTLQYLFFIAQSLERRGDSVPALGAYEQAYRFDSTSQFLLKKVTTLGLALHKPGTVIRALKGNQKLEEMSDSTLRAIIDIYTLYQVYEAALLAHNELDSVTLEDSLRQVSLYEKTHKYNKAIALYEKLFPDKPAEIRLKVADLCRLDGKYNKAEELYQSLIDDNLGIEGASEGLALTMMAQGKNREGVNVLRELITTGEETGKPHIMARDIFGSYLWSIGKLDSAITVYAPLYTGVGTEDDLRYGRTLGVYYYLNKQYAKAIVVLEELLEYPLDDAYELFYLFGAAKQSLGHLDEAEKAYLFAVELKEDFLDAQRALALLYLETERIDDAIESALRLTINSPENSAGWALSGAIYNMQQKYEEAIPFLEKAFLLTDTNVAVLFEYAMALERTDNRDSAEVVFSRLLKIDSTHAAASNYLGYMWAEDDKNLDDAKKLVENALKEDPQNGAYLDSYGWVLYRLEDYENSLKYLLQSLELMPDEDYIIYVHAGDVYKAIGNIEKARELYTKAKTVENADNDVLEEKIQNLLNHAPKTSQMVK